MNKNTAKKLEAIAIKRTGIDTLETQYNDDHDFLEVSVWGLQEMLEQAYALGRKEATEEINK